MSDNTVNQELSDKVIHNLPLTTLESFLLYHFGEWTLTMLQENDASVATEIDDELYTAYVIVQGRKVNVVYYLSDSRTQHLTFRITFTDEGSPLFAQKPNHFTKRVFEYYTGGEYTLRASRRDAGNPNTCYGFIQVSLKGRNYRVQGYAGNDGVFYPTENANVMVEKSTKKVYGKTKVKNPFLS